MDENKDNLTVPARKKPRQFSLRFLFLLTVLSVGQAVIMRLLPEWQVWFLLYVLAVSIGFGFVFSTERGGPGSFFAAMLWTAVAVACAFIGLLCDVRNTEPRWGVVVAVAWSAFCGDVIGGACAWCWRWMIRIVDLGLKRQPRRLSDDESI